jgi:magnesium transporter
MSRKLVKKRGRKIGAPPGTLVHVGEQSTDQVRVRVLDYDHDKLSDQWLPVSERIRPLMQSGSVSWIHADGVHEVGVVESLGQALGLHPLVMEDILNTDQRPKLEPYDDYLFVVLKMLEYDDACHETRSQQVSVVIGKHYVLSLQERPNKAFDQIRERLQAGRRIRFLGSDYLAYALIDAITDHYFTVLEKFGDEVELLEDELMGAPNPEILNRIHHLKREMLLLRKAIWPLREVLSSLSRNDLELISDSTRLYLRDVYDHVVHALDTVETLRDLLTGMIDLYMSTVSNRMNEVMKVLTIIATLFMPLTFIAGVYGMNFEYMPELVHPWGYPAVMVAMLLVVLGLLYFFRRKGWI